MIRLNGAIVMLACALAFSACGGDKKDSAERDKEVQKAIQEGMQKELEAVKEIVFSEPIVEAVARIKIVLNHEGLIKMATVRRPQLGISEGEKKQLLDSYRALKKTEFHSSDSVAMAPRNRAVG